MQTPYDWLTMALFAALIVVFLQRSVDGPPSTDRLWHYLPPAIGCAVIDQIGNIGWASGGLLAQIIAVAGLGALLAYGYFVLGVRGI